MGCGASNASGHSAVVGEDEAGRAACTDPVLPFSSLTSSASIYLGGEWQFENANGEWCVFSSEVNAQLLVAWYCGDTEAEYSTEDDSFDVDFQACVQTSRQTGASNRIGWVAAAEQADEAQEEAWVEYGGDEQEELLRAWASGQSVVHYSANNCDYEVDFVNMVHKNLTSGVEMLISLDSADEQEGAPDVAVAEETGGTWVAYIDAKSGATYYSNGTSTRWDRPLGVDIIIADNIADPAGEWFECIDAETGRPYYINGQTTTWEKPLGVQVHPTVKTNMAIRLIMLGAQRSCIPMGPESLSERC